MGLQPKPQKEPWVCTQVRQGRKGFFWGEGLSQISPFADHQGLLNCACHLILFKESTPWRAQVRLRFTRLGLSMRWPVPLKLWREWNGYYNEEAIGLSLSRRSIRFGETNFNLLSFPLLVIFTAHLIWKEVPYWFWFKCICIPLKSSLKTQITGTYSKYCQKQQIFQWRK